MKLIQEKRQGVFLLPSLMAATFLLLSTVAFPGYSQVFGALANFDVVNDTGKVAHGFEIDIAGIRSTDISSLFGAANRWPNMERYGNPTVTDTGTGVKIVYQATYNGAWSAGTPSGTLPVSPSDSCWPLGAKAYGPNYPCDHFGVSTSVSTPNVTYSWLVETAPGANTLTPVLATVPNPVWTVTPVPPVANVPQAPKVNVLIVAPPPNAYEFGEPRWVKVTATGVLRNVAVEDLVAENAVIQKAKTQTQLEWQLLQFDAGNPSAKNGQIDLTGVALDPGATGVVYRFEFYQYTGKRDPVTNEALVGPNGDTPGAIGPSPGDLGQFIVAQNAGINFDGVIPPAPPLPIAPSLNATINGATVYSPYSQVISATPGNPGDNLAYTLTGTLPAGLAFAGNTISGTPTVVGTFPFTITVKDTLNGLSTSGSTSINVADAAIVFPKSFGFVQGTVNVPYNQPISVVSGGYGAITFFDNKTLPAGLAITGNAASGYAITGTPTTLGSTPVTITATDSLGYSQIATATLTVGSVPVATPCSGTNKIISNVSKYWLDIAGGIPNGGQSVNYAPKASTTFVAPATNFVAGELLSYSGTLDKIGFCIATQMTVAPGLSLSSPSQLSLPTGTVGSAYTSTAVTPAGGVKPYTVSVSGLPKGLAFTAGKISGIPAVGTNGTPSISISVNDANGQTVNTTLTLTINPSANPLSPIVTATPKLPAGIYGVAYTGSAVASGGVGTLSWSASSLPAGLAISAAGAITGKPTALGTLPVVLTVNDSAGQNATVNGTITVTAPAVVIKSSSIPATGKVGSAYSATETATGGYGALTWSATGLPAGVGISSTGTVSGTPTTAATYPVVLTVTDTLGTKATVTGSVVISPAPVVAGPSCTPPANATGGLNSLGTITAINGNVITISTGDKVTVPACASIQWNGGASAFALGQVFDWNGYNSAATGNVAQQVTIN